MGAVVILSGYRQGQSIREQELEDARARSHAAFVSHARRRLEGLLSEQNENRNQQYRLPKHPHPTQKTRRSRKKLEDLTQPEPKNLKRSPQSSSLFTLLSQSRKDPFNTDTLRELPMLAQKSLEHAYLNIMPKFDYTLTPTGFAALVAHWRRTAVQSPLTFHAHVSNAVSLCYAISTDPEVKTELLQLRLKHQLCTMRIIREKIQELKGPADDDLLENLLRIASQGGNLYEGSSSSRYPETPLADALLLKLYSQFELGLPHWRAIVELIKSRGGIENISRNFSRRIVLSDVVVSSRLGICPAFPVLQEMRRFSDAQQFDFDRRASELFSLMETGWWTSIMAHCHSDLVILAVRAACLTAALDQTQRRGKGYLPFFVLCGLSTIYQHDLNQLNPRSADVLDRDIPPGDIFPVVRLAVQIFTNLVLFPLSQGWAAKPRLLKDMRQALDAYGLGQFQSSPEDGSQCQSSSSLLLWATVMGTVLSEGTVHTHWFMGRLTRLFGEMELGPGSWKEFKGILIKYLWWDYLFDDHAKDIWDEVWGLELLPLPYWV